MFSDLREEQQNIINNLINKNNELQKRFNDYQDRKIEENANLMKRLDIADKKLTVFSRELEQANKENEKLKEYIKNLQIRKDRYYLQVLEYEKQVSDWITFYIKIRDIVLGNYEILDSQGLQDLRRIVNNIIIDQKESEQ